MVWHGGRRRGVWRAPLAAVVTVSLVVAGGARADALPVPVTPAGPPTASTGRAVTGVRETSPQFVRPRGDADVSYTVPGPLWPPARRVSVAVPSVVDTDGYGDRVRAQGLPVWVQAVADPGRRYAGPSTVEVAVADRNVTAAAGVRGVLVTVTGGSAGTGRLRVGVDYAGFGQAYGGNYGSRLRLVRLPACALVTPSQPQCRAATPLGSVNDASAATVSAPLTVGGAEPATTVLAVEADPGTDGGSGGSYAATDLRPSGTWAQGGSTGAFSYSYPLTVPPGTGPVPNLGLRYNSSAVDGQTAATQAQASWAGDGWGTPDSYIEQSFVSCADNPQGSPSPKKTYDQCYNGPILTVSLNGSSTPLVWDATRSTWRPKNDDGSVVRHVVNSGNGSGTYNSDYWTLTGRDGTVYSFGRNRLPGWASGRPVTNSVDHAPVYSAHAGGPCYVASGFDASYCTMAYRWHLDYVTDVHGGAAAYYYRQEFNYYGQNLGAANTRYVRGSYLDRIDYGFTDGNAYGTVPSQALFATGDRCLSGTCRPLSEATKANWPDVPYDLVCAAGASCSSYGPAFFSTVRLTGVSTRQYSTAQAGYRPVDSYALTHTMPATGDGTSPTLWLASITRTGQDTTAGGSTTPITLPAVSFTSIKLANRVDHTTTGLPAFYRHRLQTITTETGSVITASYERPAPCPVPVTLTPAANTSSCYPVRWTPAGFTDPIVDWFNKYVLTRVTQTDPTGGAPATSTSYAYLGGAAWHFDDNELVKAKHRSYGQYRGYARVQTRTGDGANDRRTLSEIAYYRGMSKNNSSTVVNVTDSAGGVHEDLDQLAGSPLETTSYLGDGGPVEQSTITSYWISAATATRSRTGLAALTATWVAPVQTYTRQAVTAGGITAWRYTQTNHSYDATIANPTVGLLLHSYSHTVPADPAYDRCTSTRYAPVNTGRNLVGLVVETDTVSVACAGYTQGSPASVPGSLNTLTAPATVNRPAQVVAHARTFYDDPTFATTFPQPAAPTKGDVTMTRAAVDHSGGAYTYQTTARSVYDSRGRVTGVYDGNGTLTSTTYTTDAVGLTTATTVTNALGHSATTTVGTLRGVELTTTDINGVVITQQYDALGRKTGIWLHSRPTSTVANYAFAYTVSQSGLTAVTTNVSNEALGVQTTTMMYDGLLRKRQTQTATPQSGRMVTDTFYDSRGWVRASYNGWWDPAATPNISVISAANLQRQVPNQTFYTYDGLGRAVIETRAKDGLTVSTTTTVHNGDRTTVIPPTGGVTTSTHVDPLGRTNRIQQYTTAPALTSPADPFTGRFSLTGGVAVSASYGYDGHGNQHSVSDATATWTTGYDLLGRVVGKTDPDAGTSTMSYDGNGNLLQSTDARGRTVSFSYDPINRKTGQYAAPVTGQSSGNQLAKWVYDNSDGAIATPSYVRGQQTSATAYWAGNAYTVRQKNFNIFGKSTGTIVDIPAAEGSLLGKTWTISHTYTTNAGLPHRDVYPLGGGLPSETVTRTYSGPLDMPNGIGGLAAYGTATYDAYRRVNQQALGTPPNQAYVTNTWDPHTGRLTDRLVTRTPTTPATVERQQYSYDLAGNITRQISTRFGQASTSETQCFGYDRLARLTRAWTATDNCAVTPTPTSHAMVGNPLGAASAYWTSWTLDDQGNRTQQTQHATAGGADATTSYSYNGNGTNQPHTLTGTATTGAATATTSYRYDPAGNMTSRTAGHGNQTLTWNDAGRLTAITGSTAGASSLIYDPDGNLLLQKDPGTTTLYLPGQQVTLNTAAQTVTGTRYYPLPGGGTAMRTGSATNYRFALADQHATPTLYLDNTAQTPTWRQYTPYGDHRGPTTTWPDNHGFLDKPLNTTTGLTHLGAREYDPTTGRFISVDPIHDLADPQQWNAYAYAANNPVTYSDPSGLEHDSESGPCTVMAVGCRTSISSQDQTDRHTPLIPGKARAKPSPDPGKKPEQARRIPCDARAQSTLGCTPGYPVAVPAYCAQVTDSHALLSCINDFGPAEGDPVKGLILLGIFLLLPLAGELSAAELTLLIVDAQSGGAITAAGTGTLVVGGGRVGSKVIPRLLEACSFSGDMQVLVAGGTTKALAEIQVGDVVVATDPETGEQGPRPVSQVWVHDDTLLELTLDGKRTVTTTEDHPFWNATDRQWQQAQQLDSGDELHSLDGDRVTVRAIDWSTTHQGKAYSLTVDDLHTYYILAGDTSVLVHNCGNGVHIDIGGEGRYTDAINLNPNTLTSTTGAPGQPIPNLVVGVGEHMPFASGVAGRITVENAPIRTGAAQEIARVIAPGGRIILTHPAGYAQSAHAAVIDAVGGRILVQTTIDDITTTIIIAPG